MDSSLASPSPLSSATTATAPPRTRLADLPPRARTVALAWLALAITIAATRAFENALPLIGVTTLTAIVGGVIGWRRSPALRAYTAGLDLRWPIALHLVRIVFGLLFLAEYAAGRLPARFAERGGYGDLAVGALALVVLAAWRAAPSAKRGLAWVFSIVGLTDILLVFATAQYGVLVEHDPLLLSAIGRLPYAMLPTVVVPLVILTHLLVMQRLRADARAARALAERP